MFVVVGMMVACGGPSATDSRDGLEIDVQGSRLGRALHIEVTGIGRRVLPGGPLEDAELWQVKVKSQGADLQRAVNGSARIERDPVGPVADNRWDVTVHFDVAFVGGGERAEVWVTAPRADARRFVLHDL